MSERDYENLPKVPKCLCGAEMEVPEWQSDFECNGSEAWHRVLLRCPICKKEATGYEVFAMPRYDIDYRYKEGE